MESQLKQKKLSLQSQIIFFYSICLHKPDLHCISSALLILNYSKCYINLELIFDDNY